MKSLPVGELKAQFSEVLEKVQQGESFEITYGKNKKPLPKIVPINGTPHKKTKRVAGLNRGTIWTSKDFDAPIPEGFWVGKA